MILKRSRGGALIWVTSDSAIRRWLALLAARRVPDMPPLKPSPLPPLPNSVCGRVRGIWFSTDAALRIPSLITISSAPMTFAIDAQT